MDGVLNLLVRLASIVYYRLHLASAIILSSLLYIATSSGYMATVISTTWDLLSPICSESRSRVSRKPWSHLMLKVLSFVITFSFQIVITFFVITFIFVITFFVITFVRTNLSLHFICMYNLFVITFLSLHLSIQYNIITNFSLSRG